MNTQAVARQRASLHPAAWVAALSIAAFSVAGIAKMTGVIEPDAAVAPPEAAVSGIGPVTPPVAVPALPETLVPAATTPVRPAERKERTASPAAKVVKPVAAGPTEAHTIGVAEKTYDPGIDIIPARPQIAAEQPPAPVAAEAPAPVCADCGVIESVREAKVAADPSGLGAAAGGVVGGLLGNQVGKGSGRTIATIIGIAGGAYAGHEVEKTQRTTSRWNVGVRMENGEYRTISLDAEPVWRTGDRVRLQGGQLVASDH
ncbi:glycine zipper 2TM domain-containing protein [Methyloversatilis sp.]|uniref:glycine zipper 2TM domain-containing protein n=1 Tax=Methyloversatilis sp. TaxID=2569862 RepID=UPI0035B0BCBE